MDGIERQRRALGGDTILSDTDLIALTAAAQRVERLMLDGHWHTATQIIGAAGQREGLRRMRELRTRYTIQRRASGPKSREWEYRLDVPLAPRQERMF